MALARGDALKGDLKTDRPWVGDEAVERSGVHLFEGSVACGGSEVLREIVCEEVCILTASGGSC